MKQTQNVITKLTPSPWNVSEQVRMNDACPCSICMRTYERHDQMVRIEYSNRKSQKFRLHKCLKRTPFLLQFQPLKRVLLCASDQKLRHADDIN